MSARLGKAAPYATARPALVRQPGNERGILRHSDWDALLILLAAAYAGLVLSFPYFPIIALGLWWNSNTIAHYFIHRPFFRAAALNAAFSLFLSVLLGVPQTLWRERHLAHHAGKVWRARVTGPLAAETLLILSLWSLLLFRDSRFFLLTYLPAYFVGLGLCWVHGYYEHARGIVSHYGRLYNFMFLNDGYHIEHHAHPAEHWTRLPRWMESGASASRWPAVLRWLERKKGSGVFSAFFLPQTLKSSRKKRLPTPFLLETLERGVLRSRTLQWFVLQRHEAAFRHLLPKLPSIRTVAIVGGGLFPRTLIILERLLPEARFVVIDRSAANIERARAMVHGDITFIHETYSPALVEAMDLVVIPLSFVGDREAIYHRPPARAVVIHDWLWRPRGYSAVVSFFLLKRLNLVER